MVIQTVYKNKSTTEHQSLNMVTTLNSVGKVLFKKRNWLQMISYHAENVISIVTFSVTSSK